jgi:hypothetical protein
MLCSSRVEHMIWPSAVALLFAGVVSGATFNYSVSCPAMTIGPDTIPAFSNSGTLSLTPNVLLIPSDLHVLHLQMVPIGTNPTTTFTSTLSCQFTFNGQTTTANRLVTMTVNFLIPGGEQHQYAFQAFSVTASAGAAGDLTIAEAALGFNFLLQAVASDFQTTLLLAPAQPAPSPAPSSLFLLLTGLAAVGVYHLARKRLNTSG